MQKTIAEKEELYTKSVFVKKQSELFVKTPPVGINAGRKGVKNGN